MTPQAIKSLNLVDPINGWESPGAPTATVRWELAWYILANANQALIQLEGGLFK